MFILYGNCKGKKEIVIDEKGRYEIYFYKSDAEASKECYETNYLYASYKVIEK